LLSLSIHFDSTMKYIAPLILISFIGLLISSITTTEKEEEIWWQTPAIDRLKEVDTCLYQHFKGMKSELKILDERKAKWHEDEALLQIHHYRNLLPTIKAITDTTYNLDNLILQRFLSMYYIHVVYNVDSSYKYSQTLVRDIIQKRAHSYEDYYYLKQTIEYKITLGPWAV